MKHSIFYALLVGLLCCATLSQAVQREEDPSEAMVRQIAKDLRCAVCQNQSVYESNSDLAKDMLRIIRDRVRAGEEESTIRDYFFQRYGDYIYLEPTQAGKNKILWWIPGLGLLLGGLGLWFALTRWRSSPVPTGGSNPEVTAAVKTRIQQAVDRMEV